MIFVRENKFNEIVNEIREMAKDGTVEITKDDCISFQAKVAKGKRLNFSIQLNGIIIQGKEISLGNYYKNLKTDDGIYADKVEYTHLTLDKTSLSLTTPTYKGLNLSYDNYLSFELTA